jgi:uncharacterized protein YkwD
MRSPARRLAILLALGAALLVGAPAQAAPHTAVPLTLSGPQARMYEAMNAARARNGLPGVAVSRTLMAASARYAETLAKHHVFQHASRIRTSRAFSRVGEILARSPGRRAMIDPIVDAWIASPDHRPILLGGQFQAVGLAMAKARYDGQWWTVWVVRFGEVGR